MLSDRQVAAIWMIVAGRKYKDVEDALGTSHAQLWRWRQEPEFQRALEQERARVHEQRRDMLWSVHERSMEVILQSLDEGDPKMAIDVFRIGAPGLTDIKHVEPDRGQLPAGSGMLGEADAESDADVDVDAKADREAKVLASENGHICGTCSKMFKSAAGLRRHARTHAD